MYYVAENLSGFYEMFQKIIWCFQKRFQFGFVAFSRPRHVLDSLVILAAFVLVVLVVAAVRLGGAARTTWAMLQVAALVVVAAAWLVLVERR